MIPAVPAYLGEAFKDAAPGHRYSLYFSYWKPGTWKPEDKQKAQAAKSVIALPESSKVQMQAIIQRLAGLARRLPEPHRLEIYGRASAPFVTGMGIEHPLENGFAFLNPYGLPYLPGSGVKGVLRSAAQQMAQSGEAGWNPGWVDELFGQAATLEDDGHRGALTFLDCVPKLPASGMALEIMTPHYSDYYQGKGTPHDAGSPNPIVFLTVPAGSRFTFHVLVKPALLRSESLLDGGWRAPLQAAFELAFEWIGFGAKTAVGYGAMALDTEAQARVREEAEQEKREKREQERLASMSPLEQKLERLGRTGDPNMASYLKVLKALQQGEWKDTAEEHEVALWLQREMQAAGAWKEQSSKKNPKKDKEYQNTLVVKKYLG